MRIFLAGATGAIGRRLLPMLLGGGHDVVGTTRTPAHLEGLTRLGATAVLMDGLDRAAVRAAVTEAEPDVVIHQLTSLSNLASLRNLDRDFVGTNRLRTEGTDNLLAAAVEAGAHRFVAQSFTGWPNARTGGLVKDETDPLDPAPVATSRRTIAAIGHVERTVPRTPELEGIVLRYGFFYGPGTGLGEGGPMLEMIRGRKFPVVGDGAGLFSLVHIDDAAGATLRAIDHGSPGIYNIVDDEPAPVAEWLPYLADVLGAKPPRHLPVWLGRLAAGEQAVAMMTQARGSSNAKARRELDWTPRYPSWREGFRSGLADATTSR